MLLLGTDTDAVDTMKADDIRLEGGEQALTLRILVAFYNIPYKNDSGILKHPTFAFKNCKNYNQF